MGLTSTPGGSPSPTAMRHAADPYGYHAQRRIVEKGDLYDEMLNDFLITSLGGGVIDSWDLEIFEGDSLYVNTCSLEPGRHHPVRT